MAAVSPRGGPARMPELRSNASIGEIATRVAEQVGAVVRSELEAARSELRDEGLSAAASTSASAVAGATAIGFAALALARFLSLFLPRGIAYALVALASGAAAAGLLQRPATEPEPVRPLAPPQAQTGRETAVWGSGAS